VLPQIPIEVNEGLTIEVKPVRILDQINKVLRNKRIFLVKVLWRSLQMEEETWEREVEMRNKYPGLFFFLKNLVRNLILRTKFSFVGGKKCNSRAKFLYFDLFLK
jgi:hypothetical protein